MRFSGLLVLTLAALTAAEPLRNVPPIWTCGPCINGHKVCHRVHLGPAARGVGRVFYDAGFLGTPETVEKSVADLLG